MIVREKNDLIYELIFSKETDYIIDIGDYIEDIYEFDEFVSDIKTILKRSKVTIVRNSVDVNDKTVKWKLKIKK